MTRNRDWLDDLHLLTVISHLSTIITIAVSPQVVEVIRNIRDKDYNNEGELSLELNQ
jgi:hypothetical protein